MTQFNKPNLQNLQQYMEKSKSGDGSNIKWWRLPTGTSVIRILPPWDATGRIALPVWSHRITYQEPGSSFTKYSWTCLHKTFDKPCNICRGLDEIRAAGATTDEWEANSRAFYANVLVVQDPNFNKTQDALPPYTHVLLSLPKSVYDWVVAQITNPQIGDITDIMSGIDIFVTRSGAGLETRYSSTLSPSGRQPVNPEVLKTLELYNIEEIFSTGFEDQRIEGLVNSLRSAATQLGSSIPQATAQMYQPQGMQQPAIPQQPYGYPPQQFQQTPPQYQYPATPQYAQPQQPIPPQVPQYQQQQMQIPPNNLSGVGAPPQFQQTPPAQMAPPAQAQVPPTVPPQQPVQQGAQTTQYPKCFRTQYDPAAVNCITCPYEIECQNK